MSSGKGKGEERSPGDQQGEGQDGTQDGEQRGSPMLLPAPEEFETPEEYRRALGAGMQTTVPDEYRSTNLRYYEELFRQ